MSQALVTSVMQEFERVKHINEREKLDEYDLDFFIEDFQLNTYDLDRENVDFKALAYSTVRLPIYQWYCSDQFVGWYAYLNGDELVCLTLQEGRKCDIDVFWASNEVADRWREIMIAATVPERRSVMLIEDSAQVRDWKIPRFDELDNSTIRVFWGEEATVDIYRADGETIVPKDRVVWEEQVGSSGYKQLVLIVDGTPIRPRYMRDDPDTPKFYIKNF